MKILVCCGSGLGSSFMIEMNVKKVLKELNIVNIEVDHSDLGSARGINADIYIATRDLASELESIGKPIVTLNNMFDLKELKEKVSETLKILGIM